MERHIIREYMNNQKLFKILFCSLFILVFIYIFSDWKKYKKKYAVEKGYTEILSKRLSECKTEKMFLKFSSEKCKKD